MRKLGFAVAGVQKGGTTTLAKLLNHHAGLQMASVKETHFFDNERHDWTSGDYSPLNARFPNDDDRLRGEATPITLYWRPAVRRMRAYNPDLKLILLLRDPVERAFSNWRHVYAMGREPLPFAEAIRAGRARVTEQAEMEGLQRMYSYVERGQYAPQLDHLLAHFPRAQIHCQTTESFTKDQAAGLAQIADFLGVGSFPGETPVLHENPARPVDYPSVLTAEDAGYLRELFRPDIAAAEAFLGRSIPEWSAGRA